MIRSTLHCIVGVVSLLLLPQAAQSSCNSIPSADSVRDEFSKSSTPAPKGYKGALGRIDRAMFVSGTSRSMVLVPDGICVADPKQQAVQKQLALEEPKDLVVLLLLPAADGSKTAIRAWADDETCKALEAKMGTLAASAPASALMLPCSLAGLETLSTEPKLQAAGLRNALRIALPSPDETKTALGTNPALIAPRIVVARKPDSAAVMNAMGTLLESALLKPCHDICGAPSDAQTLVCIDDLYASSTSKLGILTYTKDPVPCAVGLTINVPTLDVSTACETDITGPPRPNCPLGTPELPDVPVWQDKCGGVHVPLSWKEVRPTVDGEQINPRIYGRSAIGRAKPAKDAPIRLPGREFIGTTPVGDPCGVLPGTDWRKPDIELWPETPNDADFGLMGVVDEDDSIVHVYPQIPVSLVCKGTAVADNACLGVERQRHGKFGVVCACRDRQPAGCSCDTLASPARYFVCGSNSDNLAGMPCTRDQHCNPGGSCDGVSRCQKPGAVWSVGAKVDEGPECRIDTDCPPQGDPGNKHLTQCGYRLFDLREAIETPSIGDKPTGVIKLNHKIKANGHKRRGLCDDGSPCSNGNDPGAPGGCTVGDCRGRILKVGLPDGP